jgi:hypothetical protein
MRIKSLLEAVHSYYPGPPIRVTGLFRFTIGPAATLPFPLPFLGVNIGAGTNAGAGTGADVCPLSCEDQNESYVREVEAVDGAKEDWFRDGEGDGVVANEARAADDGEPCMNGVAAVAIGAGVASWGRCWSHWFGSWRGGGGVWVDGPASGGIWDDMSNCHCELPFGCSYGAGGTIETPSRPSCASASGWG